MNNNEEALSRHIFPITLSNRRNYLITKMLKSFQEMKSKLEKSSNFKSMSKFAITKPILVQIICYICLFQIHHQICFIVDFSNTSLTKLSTCKTFTFAEILAEIHDMSLLRYLQILPSFHIFDSFLGTNNYMFRSIIL